MTTLTKSPPERIAGDDRLTDVDLDAFVKRELCITLMLDDSGSMKGKKMTQLNWAVRQIFGKLAEMSETHFAGIDVRVQVVSFSDTAQAMFSEPTPVSKLIYRDLSAAGSTNMVAGIDLWRDQLAVSKSHGLQPVGILLTDGHPNHDPTRAIERLLSNPAGRVSQRAAIAFGHDADRSVLEKFISEGQKVYDVDSPEELAESLEAATLATIEGSVVGNDNDTEASVPAAQPVQTQFTQLDGGITDEEREELLKNGYDPKEFEGE